MISGRGAYKDATRCSVDSKARDCQACNMSSELAPFLQACDRQDFQW